ncbi:tRNA (adenosine(37)-N6)-threonylcarbamoyltransferase complex dimerization subunit type 1 TsaB [Dactylosporangium matsuzakiense]|uniref:tRNA (Adenosine(37)-N6)-threonylcarbamoyltransferase complex dimerization subunit type 1 TsaB n=1 Tax=Dactylosporangium matsuzakiense TaxID=53360 RepID=A0A9W6KE06_9ACTN|nr:tRNA (adenosine(37)-N6)-threonylcarbamoyltransferase complex dimerization subunit type 1 TsaB [Dactylosporangium matsuzakiense]UWZ44298.1 tRNA (adenosine(37)-N6)-threonylcarbamoyltransferase complex dimerization subunit type 1 TsaB [Dactylosporangium matsuzakiense]GLK99552.1 tRNA (adenosine(37)-N6)-threonylcarbamoyltransferase complex dimerization subunit type 1 TsaB [Dactylosporangium matsuzakiense]
MLVMVVDTATAAVTAALAKIDDGVTLLAERVTIDARGAGELLAPQIHAVLAESGAAPGDLAAVVAGVGPGPFTGLRAGMVTAAALGHALAIPVYGVCTLDAIGLRLPGRALVATDARRKEIYWAVYADGQRIAGPDVARPDAVALDGVALAAGDGAEKYAEVLHLPVDGPRYPSALALAELAADRVRGKAPGETLTPLYLRRPDAVLPGERKPALQ